SDAHPRSRRARARDRAHRRRPRRGMRPACGRGAGRRLTLRFAALRAPGRLVGRDDEPPDDDADHAGDDRRPPDGVLEPLDPARDRERARDDPHDDEDLVEIVGTEPAADPVHATRGFTTSVSPASTKKGAGPDAAPPLASTPSALPGGLHAEL